MKSLTTKWYSIITGTIFLLLLLIIFVFLPCPTNPQLNFFRIFIALAAASFAATIPGSIKVSNKFVVATSGIGVFVLIYLVNPAGWANNGCDLKNLKITVYVDEKPTTGVELMVPDLRQKFITDEFGNVVIEYSASQLSFPTKINFIYKSQIDTIISVEEPLQLRTEIHLASRSAGLSNVSISGNSISYDYNDINLNLSLVNENKFEDGFDDTINYRLIAKGDTVQILPTSRILDQIRSNSVVEDILTEDDPSFGMNLPQLDFKFTNNSQDAVFINEILLSVDNSKNNNNAMIIPVGLNVVGFSNIGWGDATNVKIDFSLIPAKNFSHWLPGPYDKHFEYKSLPSGIKNTEDSFYSDINFGIAELLDLPEKAFEYGEQYDEDSSEANKEKFVALVGDYYRGGVAYGTFSYTDDDGIDKQEKFVTGFEISGGYGAGIDLSSQYNTFIQSSGSDYTVSIPVSQGIKAKDFDRFSVRLASAQSSKHYFKIKVLYNNKTFELPFVFYLDYFNTPARKKYLKKMKS